MDQQFSVMNRKMYTISVSLDYLKLLKGDISTSDKQREYLKPQIGINEDLADEDIEYMTQGYHNGILSEQRLEEAVLRILTTKVALRLHVKQRMSDHVPTEALL